MPKFNVEQMSKSTSKQPFLLEPKQYVSTIERQRNIQLEKFQKELYSFGPKDLGITFRMNAWEQKKDFINEGHRYKFCQKKLVAQAFVSTAYGTQNLMKELMKIGGQKTFCLSINQKKYDIILKSIVTEAIRKLEFFLLQQCHHVFMKLYIQELSKAFDILIHCHKQLLEEETQVLLGIIRIFYDIKDSTIDKNSNNGNITFTINQVQALKLYIKIRTHIARPSLAPKQIIQTNSQSICVESNKQNSESQSQKFAQLIDLQIHSSDFEQD